MQGQQARAGEKDRRGGSGSALATALDPCQIVSICPAFSLLADTNLVLGRILPAFFPHIFGPQENEPLDADGARCTGG